MEKAYEYYLKACKALDKEPIPILEDRSDMDAVSIDAYARLIICIRYMNMINGKAWEPVYDENNSRYNPRFNMNDSRQPLCISYSFDEYTSVGSRLEYRDRGLVDQGIEILRYFYNDYFNNSHG